MGGWHHWLNGLEFERSLGVSEGQGSLACCSPWGYKESHMTERMNNECSLETGDGDLPIHPLRSCSCYIIYKEWMDVGRMKILKMKLKPMTAEFKCQEKLHRVAMKDFADMITELLTVIWKILKKRWNTQRLDICRQMVGDGEDQFLSTDIATLRQSPECQWDIFKYYSSWWHMWLDWKTPSYTKQVISNYKVIV